MKSLQEQLNFLVDQDEEDVPKRRITDLVIEDVTCRSCWHPQSSHLEDSDVCSDCLIECEEGWRDESCEGLLWP